MLSSPEAFTAVDSISRDEHGEITFHYTLVEVAGVPVDQSMEPTAGDDALDAMWCEVGSLFSLSGKSTHCSATMAGVGEWCWFNSTNLLAGVTRQCPKIAQDAAARYGEYI